MIALVEGAEPAEDAQRDRAEHPAGQPDDRLPRGHRRRCSRSRSTRGAEQSRRRAGRAPGLPDPDHHRRPALGDRHRRHGPAGAAQRAGDVGPRGRGGRRRRTPCCSTRPARSRSATGRPPSSSRSTACDRGRARRRRPALQPGRRDAGGPLDRRARQGRRTACASARAGELAARDVRPVHRPDPDVRRRPRAGRADPQGCGRLRCMAWVRENGGHPTRGGRRSRRRDLRPAAAPRSSSPSCVGGAGARARRGPPQGRRQGRACASASTRCAGWASAP